MLYDLAEILGTLIAFVYLMLTHRDEEECNFQSIPFMGIYIGLTMPIILLTITLELFCDFYGLTHVLEYEPELFVRRGKVCPTISMFATQRTADVVISLR